MKLEDVNVDETINFKENQKKMRQEEQEKNDSEFMKGVAYATATFIIIGILIILYEFIDKAF